MALVEKRPRSPTGDDFRVAEYKKAKSDLLPVGVNRTSSMLAPIMLLQGHGGEILTLRFDPSGSHCASGGYDKDIFLWGVHGECVNYGLLKGHKQAVVQLQWTSDGVQIWSCSADKTVMLWDAETAKRVKKYTGHSSFVNSVCPSRKGVSLGVSGSDDGLIKVWDPRARAAVTTLTDKYQVTAVEFSDDGSRIYSGGLDNQVKVWDLRKADTEFVMLGHSETVSGLRLSPDGNFLLSNSMDNTLRVWDIRPYVEGERCQMVFAGHSHNFEKNLLRCAWSPDGSRVTCGSADKMVYVFDVATSKMVYKLPGHSACVNEVDFHPYEPILGSCGSDKKIFLGEIEPY